MDDRADEYAVLLGQIIARRRTVPSESRTQTQRGVSSSDVLAHCQLYWAGEGEDFIEARSLSQEISSEGIVVCEFKVPFVGVSRLRLDPLDCMGRIELLELSVRNLSEGAQVFRIDGKSSVESLAIGGAHIPVKCSSRVIFIARDTDPKVILPAIPPDSRGVHVKVAMNISLRHSDVFEVGGRWRHLRRLVTAVGRINCTPFTSLGS